MKMTRFVRFVLLAAVIGFLCPWTAPAQQQKPFRIVVMGDSVMWGQGLREEDKIHSCLAATLQQCSGRGAIQITNLAHSGAIIGIGDNTTLAPLPGEVPTSFPTILQQCNGFNDSPESVDLVLVNGGINDINVRRILHPFVPSEVISDAVETHCHQDMKELLDKVTRKFSNATIVVSGYYPIISGATNLFALEASLIGAGVIVGGVWSVVPGAVIGGGVTAVVSAALKDKVVANCRVFVEESSAGLWAAVAEINSARGGQPRVRFADPRFQPWNAVLARFPFLYALNPDLSPQDPIAGARIAACATAGFDSVGRAICDRASMGHPNPKGAQAYADAIYAAIMNSESLVWVDFNLPCLSCGDGTLNNPYNSLSRGVGSSAEGGMINIKAGSTPETITITGKRRLNACGGTVTIGR
jgi:lysophospholipase L1-like esterase